MSLFWISSLQLPASPPIFMSSSPPVPSRNTSDTTIHHAKTDADVPSADQDVEKASADMNKMTTETEQNIVPESEANPNHRLDWDPQFKVSLDPTEDPQKMATARKWLIVILICTSALCVTCASSVVRMLLLPLITGNDLRIPQSPL